VVGGVGAWHLLRQPRPEAREAAAALPGENPALPPSQAAARTMFSMAMWMAALVAPLQILAGDLHGLNTLEHQPVKVMAMEGHYDSHPDGAPLILFGLPDDARQRVDHAVAIPKLSSLILRHDMNAPLDGLDTVDRSLHPPVAIVFWSFRVMVALGFYFIGFFAFAFWLVSTGRIENSRRFLKIALWSIALPWVAIQCGWFVAEFGRQPWVIEGVLPTFYAVSGLTVADVMTSLVAFVLIYTTLGIVGFRLLLKTIRKGPDETAGVTVAVEAAPAPQAAH